MPDFFQTLKDETTTPKTFINLPEPAPRRDISFPMTVTTEKPEPKERFEEVRIEKDFGGSYDFSQTPGIINVREIRGLLYFAR